MTPEQFVAEWENTDLKERASAQPHFEALCRMVGHTPPRDPNDFTYEYGIQKTGGGQGFADMFYRGHFAIEYKGKGKYKDLKEAYQQLLRYRENLSNPPLLIVCDIANWEIHTNWTNTEPRVYRFTNRDILDPKIQQLLRNLFYDVSRLRPDRTTEDVTAEAAAVFQQIASNMRGWEATPERIARFLTKLVFCLFAEDVGLLPTGPKGEYGIFTEIIQLTNRDTSRFSRYMQLLFEAMAHRGGEVLTQNIPYFNGLLFENVEVETLTLEALTELEKASKLKWNAINPTIFGTLFERVLDPKKRAQLGAHYTSEADIRLIVEPVLMLPLRREWDMTRADADAVRQRHDSAASERDKQKPLRELAALRDAMLDKLQTIKVLDPACGSGNFLYVSLQLLKDLEKEVANYEAFAVLPKPFLLVDPSQLYGIEKDPIAHAIASIVVWIGYIQWHYNNGIPGSSDPILKPLAENIVCRDAIMQVSSQLSAVSDQQIQGEGEQSAAVSVSEPEWAAVDVIVGNPPFLGGKKMRGELGSDYVDRLFRLYNGRVPAEADLVTYWFEKARAQIEQGKTKRAGLLATNSIRGGANREVLKRIKDTGNIFMAWGDREWILDGAAVRVSMVGFDSGNETIRNLDGKSVNSVNSDLTSSVDITHARKLPENTNMSFMGVTPAGSFDIPNEAAIKMLNALNPTGVLNSSVVKPYYNAMDLARSERNVWIIDFGTSMSQEEAARYEQPFNYVKDVVLPERLKSKQPQREKDLWWIFTRSRPEMRQALADLSRYIATPMVAKHRVFVWLSKDIIPANLINVIAREDDYFFGVLHSKIHEVWSLRMGTSLEDRPRYTPTTTFETFPFPWKPGDEPKAADGDPLSAFSKWQAVGEAAKRLHEEREAWLNPSLTSPRSNKFDSGREGTGTTRQVIPSKDRTLTDVYNALNVFRGKEKIRVKPASGDFAPRLSELHDALDAAVCLAYGWDDLAVEALHTPEGEEAVLRRLLQLNGERASSPLNPLSAALLR